MHCNETWMRLKSAGFAPIQSTEGIARAWLNWNQGLHACARWRLCGRTLHDCAVANIGSGQCLCGIPSTPGSGWRGLALDVCFTSLTLFTSVYLGATNTLEALEVGVGRSHCHPLPIMGMQWSGLSKARCMHCTDVLSNFPRSRCIARVRKGNEVARRPRWRSKSWFTW